jgi:hypothetical protein
MVPQTGLGLGTLAALLIRSRRHRLVVSHNQLWIETGLFRNHSMRVVREDVINVTVKQSKLQNVFQTGDLHVHKGANMESFCVHGVHCVMSLRNQMKCDPISQKIKQKWLFYICICKINTQSTSVSPKITMNDKASFNK